MNKTYTLLAIAGLLTLAVIAVAFGLGPDILTTHHSSGLLIAEGAAAVSAQDFKALTDKLAEVTTKFNQKSDELSKKAEEALAEVKNKGELLTATKSDVDKLLIEQTSLKGALNEAQARLTAAEQEIVRRPGDKTSAHKTIGAQLVADQKTKDFAAQGSSARGKHRFSVNAAITSVDYPVGDNPGIVQPQILPGIQVAPKQRLFVRDLIPVGQTQSPAIFWVQQTGFTNAARVVSEGTKKPESTIAYDSKMTPVSTIAHIFKASKQILADFKQLQSDVDREMRYGLKYVEEEEILFGDGTGVHLHGIIPQAEAFAPAFTVPHHNRIDDIRLAMLQAQLARLPATGIVMHFMDWAATELTKDENGQYVFANPLRLAGSTLWGLPVVPTEIADFEGNFLTGAFAGGAQLYDREEMGVEIATENNDDFEKNMLTMRCEERVALAVFRPEAFIYGGFTSAT
ncbi:phage major capsid protein [Mesorhizobium sp. M7A.F.Ca.CA.001.07.2.1]|uniref:phage major capsid protein n=3 Tax=Phyllobacteriaceae TaxID=69277 RepID=UPI000FCB8B37|nr:MULTISPECIES: phage major capsid protein [Mesorhizobium]RVB38387.1 phage major capsid protein [Mesorhizobium sp. M7A.F.Ca.CA.004.05.1.1]MCF6126058.1 phage major capsid protein [Mesorhizobium ciceri]MCQ8813907.1 phage major capsid protein [Mesorhizobium sp. SEMIA396]RUX81407.1 phage major capsid protein [Mesorhizobium sp. M7A.F.Ca.CA.004.08.2.1]RUX89431.1 phage major capsid protein [Mesorhizobium sp. M7A.F.Ca.CA.004.08.1.1]